jgi:ABC-2 type transport system permease protein
MDANPARAGAPMPAQPYGEVFDRGYQHYDGVRAGRSHAIQALIWYSVKRGLGIKKKWTAKIIPAALYVFAYIPAIVVVGVLSFVPAGTDLSYPFLNQFIRFALLVFAAATAAEMLCDDRRENVLSLYFSRAITRVDYLAAKVAALAILTGTIALGPPLLLFLGKTFLADNPISYFGHHVGDLGRVVAFALLISAYFSAIGLSVAAYTNRKGVATAIFIGGMIIIGGLANALYAALDTSARKYLLLVSPFDLVESISHWLFNDDRPANESLGAAQLSGGLMVAGVLVAVAIASFIMYRRYLADE